MSDSETAAVKALVLEADRQKQDRLRIAYQDVFEGKSGSMVLNDLSRTFHLLGPCFEAGDPYMSAALEGQRQVVLHVLNKLKRMPSSGGDDGLTIEQAEELVPDYFRLGV